MTVSIAIQNKYKHTSYNTLSNKLYDSNPTPLPYYRTVVLLNPPRPCHTAKKNHMQGCGRKPLPRVLLQLAA